MLNKRIPIHAVDHSGQSLFAFGKTLFSSLIFLPLFICIFFLPPSVQYENGKLIISFFVLSSFGLFFLTKRPGHAPFVLRSLIGPLFCWALPWMISVFLAEQPEMALSYYIRTMVVFFAFYILGYLSSQNKIALSTLHYSMLAVFTSLCVFSFAINIYAYVLVPRLSFRPLAEIPLYINYLRSFHFAVVGTKMALCFPVLILLLKSNTKAQRCFGYLMVFVCMVDLIALNVRHPLLILLILVGVYSIIQKSFWPFLISTLVLGVLAGAGHQYFPGRFFKISFDSVFFAAGGAFEHYRLARFQTALNILREHPFFGIGFEHVRLLFEQYYPLKSELVSISHEHRILDNMYLTILAETGMVGFIGFFLAMGRILILGCRTYMQTYSLYLFIALLVLLGFFLSMTSYEVIYWLAPFTLFSLFCGITSGLTAPQNSKSI